MTNWLTEEKERQKASKNATNQKYQERMDAERQKKADKFQQSQKKPDGRVTGN